MEQQKEFEKASVACQQTSSKQAIKLENSPAPPNEPQNPEVPVQPQGIWRPWFTEVRRPISEALHYNQQNHSEVSNAADIAIDNHQMKQVLPNPRTSDPVDSCERSDDASRVKDGQIQLIQKSNEVTVENVPSRSSSTDSVVKVIAPLKPPYHCAECGKQFNWKSSMVIHSRNHTGEKSYKCAKCDFACTGPSALSTHQSVHSGSKLFKCSTCDAAFKFQSSLYYHRRRSHSAHSDSKPFKCSTCDSVFRFQKYLNAHQRRHSEKQFKCDICNKAFRDKAYLADHKNFHTGEKPYACNVCNKTFALRAGLNQHRRRHTIATV